MSDASDRAPDTSPSGEPRIGVWGLLDIEELGAAVAPEVIDRELRMRLLHASVTRFSPAGSGGRNRFDLGHPVEALGAWSPERLAELVDALDCVVVVGTLPDGRPVSAGDDGAGREVGETAPSRFLVGGLGDDRDGVRPVAWSSVRVPTDIGEIERWRDAVERHAVLTVRDESSARRLEAAGIRRRPEIVPDPAVLLARVWDPGVIERRLRYLREVGAYPDDPPIVVQGSRAGLQHVEALAVALRRLAGDGVPIVVIEMEPVLEDSRFAVALAEALGPMARFATPLGLQDVAAAIAAGRGFIGSSPSGNAAAAGFDKPHLLLGWDEPGAAAALEEPWSLVERVEDVPEAFRGAAERTDRPEIRRALEERVDRHLDAVAEVAAGAVSPPPREPGVGAGQAMEALRRAHRARGRLLAAQRWQMADRVEDPQERIRELERQLTEIRATKTFRYTAALRRWYGRLRERRRRRAD